MRFHVTKKPSKNNIVKHGQVENLGSKTSKEKEIICCTLPQKRRKYQNSLLPKGYSWSVLKFNVKP